jgi:hypothetical protein
MRSPSDLGRLIVDTLTWRIRVVTDVQLAKIKPNGDLDRTLNSLVRNGLLESFSLPTYVLALEAPLYCWEPERSDEPSYWEICWEAKKRLSRRPSVNVTIFHATQMAERQFGGVGGKIRQPFQIVHDLGTASVFVAHTLSNELEGELHWVSEDVIRRYYRFLNLKKIPDAAILDNEKISTVIEFVGRDYTPVQLRRFHRYWKKKQIPYQIW